MNRKILKTVALIIVLCFVSNIMVCAQNNIYANISDEIETRLSVVSNATLSKMEQIAMEEAPAKEQYSKLLTGLKTSMISSSNSKTNENGMTLNDYYGGAYLNDDKKLTICVTSDKPEIIDTIIETTGSSEIIIQKVNYTLDEINEIFNMFENMLNNYKQRAVLIEEQRAVVDAIVEIYTNVFDNKVVVGISGLDDEKENTFWSLFNSLPNDVIELEEGYHNAVTVSIRPGGGLYPTASASTSGRQWIKVLVTEDIGLIVRELKFMVSQDVVMGLYLLYIVVEKR